MLKEIKKAFTLAEVLIVIGIIGVVAALTLPNLNHATGDKETVTRLQKAYSILNEANDRAVAIYGPISSWSNCLIDMRTFDSCYMKRIGEFLKISKSCDETQGISCNSSYLPFYNEDIFIDIIYQLSDGITFFLSSNVSIGGNVNCNNNQGSKGRWDYLENVCDGTELWIDINGPNKGKNKTGKDIFRFQLSDTVGIVPLKDFDDTLEAAVSYCTACKDETCTFWVLEYGNLDYLKADENGKCNDSNIILNGTTNTSCH